MLGVQNFIGSLLDDNLPTFKYPDKSVLAQGWMFPVDIKGLFFVPVFIIR
ncbi:MAG: hypothetical protein MJA84_00390 [Firmicutes bacterium]|nr:hypothetical protein [Bacillota bacterium]